MSCNTRGLPVLPEPGTQVQLGQKPGIHRRQPGYYPPGRSSGIRFIQAMSRSSTLIARLLTLPLIAHAPVVCPHSHDPPTLPLLPPPPPCTLCNAAAQIAPMIHAIQHTIATGNASSMFVCKIAYKDLNKICLHLDISYPRYLNYYFPSLTEPTMNFEV